jgi:hypothetical protein
MCFIVEEDPIILDEDKHVIKVGRILPEGFRPVWKGNFLYEKDVPSKKVELKVHPTDGCPNGVIEEGYHAFTSTFANARGMMKAIGQTRGLKYVDAHFVIPAGTKVYVNDRHNEVVAEQMIFKGILK